MSGAEKVPSSQFPEAVDASALIVVAPPRDATVVVEAMFWVTRGGRPMLSMSRPLVGWEHRLVLEWVDAVNERGVPMVTEPAGEGPALTPGLSPSAEGEGSSEPSPADGAPSEGEPGVGRNRGEPHHAAPASDGEAKSEPSAPVLGLRPLPNGWELVVTLRGSMLVPPEAELVIVKLLPGGEWWFEHCPVCGARDVRAKVWDPTSNPRDRQEPKLVRCTGAEAGGQRCRCAVPLEEARKRAVERDTLREPGGAS